MRREGEIKKERKKNKSSISARNTQSLTMLKSVISSSTTALTWVLGRAVIEPSPSQGTPQQETRDGVESSLKNKVHPSRGCEQAVSLSHFRVSRSNSRLFFTPKKIHMVFMCREGKVYCLIHEINIWMKNRSSGRQLMVSKWKWQGLTGTSKYRKNKKIV